MFSTNSASPNRRPPQPDRKRSFKALLNRTKPGLAVDTSFARHRGQVPQQIFPYESKTHELSFVGLDDVGGNGREEKSGLKLQLENRLPIRPSTQRSVSENTQAVARNTPDASRPDIRRHQTAANVAVLSGDNGYTGPNAPPLHKRIKGLRPSPLDLSQDVSPSDRAITIGISVPSASLPGDEKFNGTQSAMSYMQPPRQAQQYYHQGQQVDTPTIVITPAKEDFSLTPASEISQHMSDYRPASSVYSRYTNCIPKPQEQKSTPPVPPLPLFVGRQRRPREYGVVVPEKGVLQAQDRSNALSVCTVFEEDHVLPRQSTRLSLHSHAATPRRSRGWWNVITSPFSATPGAKSGPFFWRSSPVHSAHADEQESKAILEDASEMGHTDPHVGLIFTNRTADDKELRSAVAPDTHTTRPLVPKRSDTAPGALGKEVESAFDFYWVPSQGLAATYYDVGRHFPSLIFEAGAERSVNEDDAWSPSNSVFRAERVTAGSEGELSHEPHGGGIDESSGSLSEKPSVEDDEQAPNITEVAPTGAERSIFATPSEDELKPKTPPRPANERNNTNATVESYFSPLTPTPVVEEAHVARFMGPHFSNELKQVELAPTRSLSPPSPVPSRATSEAVSRPRAVDSVAGSEGIKEVAPRWSFWKSHVRSDSSGSCGLGISDGQSEKALFPPPQQPRSQPQLSTDRFGQLVIQTPEDDLPSRPWYRRFLWPLLAALACVTALMVILLVVLVPQSRNDMAVEAQWLNLTGFPAMPTGISTVVADQTGAVSGCVSPQSLWSCTAPNESQDVRSFTEDGPLNLRLEIRFRNGTLPANETILTKRTSSGPVQAGAMVLRVASRTATSMRRGWTDSLFAANPPPPSENDLSFMGQTTDNISTPFAGSDTPFYVSVLDPIALETKELHKRQGQEVYPYPTAQNTTGPASNASTSAPANVPRPALQGSGKPALAEMYPLAQAQPLRLFNRGQADEHYGFYTYFDRSIYVSNISNSSTQLSSYNVPLENASAVCTWSQTRFHVQIWTGKSVTSLSNSIPLPGLAAVNSTANDREGPGSLPYAVTVTLDRHGGRSEAKGLYCYALDEEKHIIENSKTWIHEDRAFNGMLVNAANVPQAKNSSSTLTRRDGDDHGQIYGGVDGGNGGCSCAWQNWK